MGPLVEASLSGEEMVVVAPEGATVTLPTCAVVYSGMGFRKDRKNAGVPNVSVREIHSTFDH